jgi:hypothetical protein
LEDESIKSALELAMERVSRLPELTPEEIEEQKEREFRPIGEAMSNKYMQGQIVDDELSKDLNNHQGEKGAIVRSALMGSLCQCIQLEDNAKAMKALQGLFLLKNDEAAFREEIQKRFSQLRRDFERERQIIYKKYETIFKEKWEINGICGSAIKVNLAENEDWQSALNGIRRAYEPKLKEIRNRLTDRML